MAAPFPPRFVRLVNIYIVVIIVLLVASASTLAPVHANDSYYQQKLREAGVALNAEGVSAYLRQIPPTEKQRLQAQKWIAMLGSDEYSQRDAATRQLMALPTLPTEDLQKAAKSEDFEVRWRARQILLHGNPQSESVIFAAFKTIEQKKLSATVPSLMAAIPHCRKPHLQRAAREALRAAARPQHAPRLRLALKQPSPPLRAAAAIALGAVAGKASKEDLSPLLDDSEDKVALAAARALADFGDRRTLPALARLLTSEDVQVRVQSADALRQLSGHRFGYLAFGKNESRNRAVERWRRWVAGPGQTARLHFPLKSFGAFKSYLNGNTLLAFGNTNKVVEYDPAGKTVFTYTAKAGVWSAEKLPSGNYLIAVTNGGKVVEVTPRGRTVWEIAVPNPIKAHPLENGNILIASCSGKKIMEYDRRKSLVWEHRLSSQCGDAFRLPNGNTLFAEMDTGVVREITPDKSTVWQYQGKRSIYGIQPLRNGNVLICHSGSGVTEVNRQKKIVWQFAENGAVDAFRLPSGNTLITGSKRFIEVTPEKKIVWTKTGCSSGAARR